MIKNVLRCCLPALLLFLSFESIAQKFEIVNYQEKHSSGEVYSFPILKSATNGAVAKKINEQMQNEQLEGLIDPKKKGAFAKIWPEPDSYSGTTELSYEILQNNERYFSVAFNIMGCGAYCEGYQAIYNFDSKTGNAINTSNLFTAAGAAFISRYTSCQKNKEINEVIAKLNKSLKSASGEDKENMTLAAEEYQNCKEDESQLISFEYSRLKVADQQLTIITERCFNHALAGLDELNEFVYTLLVGDFGACLTPYANDLLKTNKKTSADYRNYGGTINNTIKISMLVEVPAADQSTEGIYFYNKVAGLIKLTGTKSGNTLTLTETNDKGVKTGTFVLTVSGDALTGKWINPKTLKEMPVKLVKI